MSKTLTLIHTTHVVVPVFASLCQRYLPGVRVMQVLDEGLLQATISAGHVEKAVIRRFIRLAQSAADTGADAVMVTCSAIGQAADLAVDLVDCPVIRADRAMAEKAIATGSRIGVAATLSATMDPTMELLRHTAAKENRIVEVIAGLCPGAFDAVTGGDSATHDEVVREKITELSRVVDVVVLAQPSMARAVETIPEGERTKPVLSSPVLAIKHAAEFLRQQ
jgi:Asp/Glu/hydantoin racemase